MAIEEKTTFTATSLPGAPPRETRAEAEADEARDLITPAQFDTLTAPMRAAGVNFEGLANHNEQEER